MTANVINAPVTFHAPYPEAPAHFFVEDWASQTPENTAVISDQKTVSYAQINTRANQLAHYLLKQEHIQPGMLIGICLPRSLEFLIAMLAIMKCGAAYVPVDPTWPASVQQEQLEDAQVVLLLTQSTFVKGETPFPCLLLDTVQDTLSQQPTANPEITVTIDDVCAVLYTSGSTGKAKGVCLRHRGLVRLVYEQNYYSPQVDDVVGHVANTAFDGSLLEIWLAFVHGLPLAIATNREAVTVDLFAQWIKIHRIKVVDLTTSIFNLFAKTTPEVFAPLRVVYFGGEVANVEAVRRALAAAPRCEFVNTYGPTENSVLTTSYVIKEVAASATSIPIGKPIAYTQTYVLDERLQPVPLEEEGDLYCGGDGVAVGYLRRPALTAERFVHHPQFGLIYNSGDIVKLRKDGLLEFIGRKDGQIKVHGFRIETEEIEAALLKHPKILQAVVGVRTTPTQQQFLIAYIVAAEGVSVSYDEVAAMLAEQLPAYKVPRSLFLLDCFPQRHSGKIDRKVLPTLEADKAIHLLRGMPAQFPPDFQHAYKILCEVLAASCGLVAHDLSPEFPVAALGMDSIHTAQVAGALSQQTDMSVSQLIFLILQAPSLKHLVLNLAPHIARRRLTTMVPTPKTELLPVPAYVTRENRSLQQLIQARIIPHLDAAALTYLPAHLSPAQRQAFEDWSGGLPLLSDIVETERGRIGGYIVPLAADDLYTSPASVADACVTAVHLAQAAGARIVSLTGLLPSATNYGLSVVERLDPTAPQVTTGHATTASAVVLTIKRLLQLSGRDLVSERVAFLGLGSIGQAVLRLMLQVLPHPQSLLLCDLYHKQELLKQLRDVIVREGYSREIQVDYAAEAQLGDAIYHATLIIGATNVANVLDVARLQAGTIVIDDSGPHCFANDSALERMHKQQDVLCVEAGALKVHAMMQEVRTLPQTGKALVLQELLQTDELVALRQAQEIMGCLFSGVVSLSFGVPTTLGPVQLTESLAHYRALDEAGYTAANPHLSSTVLPASLLEHFRENFGHIDEAGDAPIELT